METQKTTVNVASKEGVVHIVTSEKKILPELARKAIILTGVLGAPGDFFEARKTQYDSKTTHLEIYKNLGKLVLVIGDEDPHSTHTITGQLSRDKELAEFHVNEEYYFTIQNMRKFLLPRAFFFSDPQECKNLISQLNQFSARVEKVIKDWNSNDGNSETSLITKVEGLEMRREFTLKIPVYQGYDKKEFKVMIGFQASASGVNLFLYSEDLAVLVHTERERIVDMELDRFSDTPFSKILLS